MEPTNISDPEYFYKVVDCPHAGLWPHLFRKYLNQIIILSVLTLATVVGVRSQEQFKCDGKKEVCTFFRHFVEVFNSRDWMGFTGTLDDEVTVYVSSSEFPTRMDGRVAVENVFRPLFPGPSQPLDPKRFMIKPEALLIQDLGETAMISFHVVAGKAVLRRSLLLRRTGKSWKIVHIHGSTESKGDE